MEKNLITRLHKSFEDFAHNDEGVEYWYARDLQTLLGYARWENFYTAISRAKEACISAQNQVTDHFLDATKMVDIGSGTQREVQKLGVPEKRALADFLPEVTISAKNLANAMTSHKVREQNLRGENPISNEHQRNNAEVRGALLRTGITPEKLPPAEDIKKLQSKIKSEGKKLPKQVKKLQPSAKS